MKKFITYLIAAAAVLSACSKNEAEKTNATDTTMVRIELTKSEIGIAGEGLDFSFDFFRSMAAKSGDGDILVSPFSLQAALSMLANGAEDQTFDEIIKALGWDGHTVDEINAMYATLTSALQTIDPEVTLESANSLWANKDFPVKSSFKETLGKAYGAEARTLDFSSPGALEAINGWCSEKTHGMIPQLLESLDSRAALVLINALYFKGDWQTKFDKSKTKRQTFNGSAGKTSMSFMHDVRDCGAISTKDLTACSFPYGGGVFSLDVFLPAEGKDFDEFVAGFDADYYRSLSGLQAPYETTISLPKFQMGYSTEDEIIPFLKSKGMNRAFSPGAQFGKLSDAPTSVNMILQKTNFKMDESGSEAAAATAVSMVNGAAPGSYVEVKRQKLDFNANHPFIYIIRERTSGTILFIGTFRG